MCFCACWFVPENKNMDNNGSIVLVVACNRSDQSFSSLQSFVRCDPKNRQSIGIAFFVRSLSIVLVVACNRSDQSFSSLQSFVRCDPKKRPIYWHCFLRSVVAIQKNGLIYWYCFLSHRALSFSQRKLSFLDIGTFVFSAETFVS